MPWILRFAVGSLFVFVMGAVMIAWTCMSRAGSARPVRMGFPNCRVGLIGAALLAMLSVVIHKEWRRFSLALTSASVFLFLVLLIFAKFA